MLAMMILDLDGFDLHHQEGRRHLTYKKKSIKILLNYDLYYHSRHARQAEFSPS